MAKEVMRVSAEEKELIELLRENGVVGNQSLVNALDMHLLPNMLKHMKFVKEAGLDTAYYDKQLECTMKFFYCMVSIRDSQM